MKEMFEEMGRLAVRGDILTVQQAEQLVESKIMGSFDSVLSSKIHGHNGPLSNALSGLASKNELEALRRMVTVMGQTDGWSNFPADPLTSGSLPSTSPSSFAQNQNPQIKQLHKWMASVDERSVRSEEHYREIEARLKSLEKSER
jgi:hypothetical protein